MPNPFTRDDTMLGVCQAIGEDTGLNQLWVGVGFGVLLLLVFGAAVGAYLALGALVLAVRLLLPDRPGRAVAGTMAAGRAVATNDADAAALDLAA